MSTPAPGFSHPCAGIQHYRMRAARMTGADLTSLRAMVVRASPGWCSLGAEAGDAEGSDLLTGAGRTLLFSSFLPPLQTGDPTFPNHRCHHILIPWFPVISSCLTAGVSSPHPGSVLHPLNFLSQGTPFLRARASPPSSVSWEHQGILHLGKGSLYLLLWEL